MYDVERVNGFVTVRTFGKPIYSASDDSLLIYRNCLGIVLTARVKDMKDEQLLTAIANAVELPDYSTPTDSTEPAST